MVGAAGPPKAAETPNSATPEGGRPQKEELLKTLSVITSNIAEVSRFFS